MVVEGVKNVTELNVLANSASSDLISSTSKIPRLLSYQITLLEVFNRELKKLDRIGHCDYELAYFAYQVTESLCRYCEKASTKDGDFISQIRHTLEKKKSGLDSVVNSLQEASNGSVDPLLLRLANLKTDSPNGDTFNHSPNGNHLPNGINNNGNVLDKFKYQESISPHELNELIAKKTSVLLIDFRTTKEFNFSHINYNDIVNIEPSHVSTLLASEHRTVDEITDMDLEERLKMHLPQDQFTRFKNRYKFDLIVIYNLRYGSHGNGTDKFTTLKDSLIKEDKNGIPSSNPFQGLIDLLAYKNKYISSRLKQHPTYLSGGLVHWHSVFGDSSLKRALPTQILSRPQASLSRGGSESPSSSRSNSFTAGSSNSKRQSMDLERSTSNSSPYLRNFGDYLSTAKSSASTPVSNVFVPGQPASSFTPMSVHDYGRPSSTPLQSAQPIHQQQAPKTPKRTLSNGSASGLVRTASRSTSSFSIDKKSSPSTSNITSSPTSRSTSKPAGSVPPNPVRFLDQYVTGLTNLGNSCYMNCVLQCLGATPQLTRFFFPTISNSAANALSLQSYRQHINVNNKLGTKGILTTNFVSLLGNMFNNTGKYFTPNDFKRVVGSLSPGQQFATFDQQDCIEFLNFILDGLHEDLNQMVIEDPKEKRAITELTPEQEKTREFLPVRLASTIEWERYLKLNFSIVVDYFQGQYLSQLRCLECHLTSTTYNAFSILSLPIPQKLGNVGTSVSLQDCLNEFTTTELLDEYNKWHCPNCKKFTKSTKKITITRLPEVLIIHFKRFKMSPTGYINKMDTFVTYPVNEVLDLTSYWPGVGTSVNSRSSDNISREEEQQILSTLPTRNQQPPFRYKLYGVANHFGNLSTGHYTSYVHKASDSKKTRNWCYFDDAKVTYNCKESQVLNKNAYCLFYQRV